MRFEEGKVVLRYGLGGGVLITEAGTYKGNIRFFPCNAYKDV